MSSGDVPGLIVGRILWPTDAGPSLTLSGPGASIELTRGPIYSYIPPESAAVTDPLLLPPSKFPGGAWTLSGPGGATVRPFEIPFRTAPTLIPLNTAYLRSIPRTQNLTILWNSAGFSSDDVVSISLRGTEIYLLGGPQPRSVDCHAPALAGQLTIDRSLLEPFEPGIYDGTRVETPQPALTMSVDSPQTLADVFYVDGRRARTVISNSTNVFIPSEIR